MNFSPETKVKEIAAGSAGATGVLERAGVDYCCGGGKSLREACVEAGVAPEEILERLRQANAQVRPEDANWSAAALCELTRHIREKHHSYVRQSIQRLRSLAAKVKARHGNGHPEIVQIETLFATLAQEMIHHMQKEEQILFPYIDGVERAAKSGEPFEAPFFQTVRNPIQAMMREHDSAGDLVKQIRKTSGDYRPPEDACTSFRALYEGLHEFETDLHQHVHLENNILFPRAVELEATLEGK
jgi:regulator of cell morphogenesis and NO signaling